MNKQDLRLDVFYTNEPLTDNLSWNDLDHLKVTSDYKPVYISPYLSYGDYDNSCHVERSNVRVFLEAFGERPGVLEVSGGFGSHAIVLTEEALKDEDILDCLKNLEDYPCISEEDCSAMEAELEAEAWESWMRSEFESALCGKFPAYDEAIGDMEDNDLRGFFYVMADEYHQYGGVEAGGGYWFDIKLLVKFITEDDLQSALEWYEVAYVYRTEDGPESKTLERFPDERSATEYAKALVDGEDYPENAVYLFVDRWTMCASKLRPDSPAVPIPDDKPLYTSRDLK